MPLTLNDAELRVLGCLMEKSVTTPDQYPLSLNALTGACNQKTSRDPVMSLTEGEVLHTLRTLEDQHLVAQESFKTRVEKYVQRFCNTPFADYQLEPDEFAVVTLLLLRGAQTPGELRSRSPRLHRFEDNGEVLETLERLAAREGDALTLMLPRTPGRQDSAWMHTLGSTEPQTTASAAAAAAADAVPTRAAAPPSVPADDNSATLTSRVTALEHEVAELRQLLNELMQSNDGS